MTWQTTTWGALATLEYGKALRGYEDATGPARVYGTNGPIGWHSIPMNSGPGVIVGRKGAYRGIHFSPGPFFVIDTAFYLKPKIEIDLRWAYYQLLTHDLNSMDSGSAIPSTSRDTFYQLTVRVPPLPMQRAIGAHLALLDNKIELNRRMTQTLEAIVQANFKSWFLDQDHSWPTDEWQTLPLDSVADFLNGLALQKYPAEERGESLPVIKIAQLRAGHTKSADRAGTNVPAAYVVNDGDLLFSWSGSLEVDFWCGGRGALNQHLFRVSSAVAPRWYAYLWTKHHLPEFRAIAANKATTMGHIQRKHLTSAEVLLPPPQVLTQMDDVMRPLVSQMIHTEATVRTMAELRDELLPKLLSGELTIDDVTVNA